MKADVNKSRIIKLETRLDKRGKAIFVESKVPFRINRITYFNKMAKNGFIGRHSNKKTNMFIVSVNGSFKVKLDDGRKKKIYTLNDSESGLFVPAMLWRELYDFSKDGIALMLADRLYDEKEYIRDYKEYKEFVKSTKTENK